MAAKAFLPGSVCHHSTLSVGDDDGSLDGTPAEDIADTG